MWCFSRAALTITERRCGVADDIAGCTLYKSIAASSSSQRRRMRQQSRRHLIAGSSVDTRPSPTNADAEEAPPPSSSQLRRRETPTALLVEVCTGGCTEDGCTSATTSPVSVSASAWRIFTLMWMGCATLALSTKFILISQA